VKRARLAGIVLAAGVLCACTATFRRDEHELPRLRPPAEPRPALRLTVVEAEIAYQAFCIGGGRLPIGVQEACPVSKAKLERQRRSWESTGLFSRVESAVTVGRPSELEVTVRIVRDLEESDPMNARTLLTLGLWPLLFGTHQDQLVSFDASFRRRGELLGEITRVERLTTHSHLLLVPLAPFFKEERALASAERDLVHAILVEAQGRGFLQAGFQARKVRLATRTVGRAARGTSSAERGPPPPLPSAGRSLQVVIDAAGVTRRATLGFSGEPISRFLLLCLGGALGTGSSSVRATSGITGRSAIGRREREHLASCGSQRNPLQEALSRPSPLSTGLRRPRPLPNPRPAQAASCAWTGHSPDGDSSRRQVCPRGN
jgi:hypothetical protein